jgi:peroxidase
MAIAATPPKMSVLATALLSLLLLAVACQASPYYPLELGYYRYKCPQAEAIVKAIIEKAIAQNPGNGAAVIRMLFHDCFVEVLYFIIQESIYYIATYIYIVLTKLYRSIK